MAGLLKKEGGQDNIKNAYFRLNFIIFTQKNNENILIKNWIYNVIGIKYSFAKFR